MKRFLFLAPLLALGGCGADEIMSAGSLAVTAVTAFAGRGGQPVTDKTVIDEQLLIGANGLYEATALAAKMAFQSGQLPVSQDPDTARDNFCELAVAGLADINDQGGRALELGCLIDHHLDDAEAAQRAKDATAYAQNLAKAGTYNAELTRIVSNHVLKGIGK